LIKSDLKKDAKDITSKKHFGFGGLSLSPVKKEKRFLGI